MSENGPQVGDIVHYVSYGTPGGEYESECRAAVVTGAAYPEDSTEDGGGSVLHLAVLNPEGMFFNRGVGLDRGGETIGDLECPDRGQHGTPHRYCACGWMEAAPKGGTWHPREGCPS